MRVRVVTPSYPTRGEPYRGAPVWATLQHLSQYVNLEAFCTVPDYHFQHRPRPSFIPAPKPASARPISFRTRSPILRWPGLTRPITGDRISPRLRPPFETDGRALFLTNWYIQKATLRSCWAGI